MGPNPMLWRNFASPAWQEGSTTGLIPALPSQFLLVLDLGADLTSGQTVGVPWSLEQPPTTQAPGQSLSLSLSLSLVLSLLSPMDSAQLCPAFGSHRHDCVDLPLPHHSPSLSIPSFLSPQVWRTLGPFCEVNVVFALFCALPSALVP